jgi:hypothetical protein
MTFRESDLMLNKRIIISGVLSIFFGTRVFMPALAETNPTLPSALSGTCNKPPRPPPSANIVQTLESFSNEYEWINVKRCKRPVAKAPPRIWIDTPKNSKMKEKKISLRRWADRDGDGICEIYDVGDTWKEDDSNNGEDYPNNRKDYPMRTMRFENGKWRIPEDWSNIWVPLILLDKVTGARIEIPYKAGNAGYDMTPMSFNNEFSGKCEEARVKLAIGYMLLFRFPKFAKNDPVMDPEGIWNDYGGGWLRSEHWAMDQQYRDSLPDDCLEKYRLVIDALKEKGAFP